MDSTAKHGLSASEALDALNKAAKADTTGTGKAHLDLLDAIQKYRNTVEKPGETLHRNRMEPLQNTSIRMALEAGLLPIIGQKKGVPITADELARATGYDALLIIRIMRLVTYQGYCDEVGEGEYIANGVTTLFNTPAMTGAERFIFEMIFPIGAVLPKYMRETGVHQFPKRPEDKSPCHYAHDGNLWAYFDAHPDVRKDFDNYMSGRREGLSQWYEMFPMASTLAPGMEDDPGAVLLVDVGGNKGHEIAGFHRAHPEVPGRLILQDLAPMIGRVRENPPKDIELMPYDFFTPQPVKGARAYYFRSVCHDWSDEQCQIILTNTAKAMEPGYSRLLIDEHVLPNTGASLRAASLDMAMMLWASGIERTESQWLKLLDACDLEIIKIWGCDSGHAQIIECQLKT